MMNDIKKQFPILRDGLVYLDSAATTQKPESVINAVQSYYTSANANPHRGVYPLAETATLAYEKAREKVATFINAPSPENVIFTRGVTESLNLLAYSFAAMVLEKGDTVVLPISEHHSNFVPWQQLVPQYGAELVLLYVDENGNIPDSEIEHKINEKTKIVSFAHVSNVLGNKLPIEKLVKRAKEVNAYTIIDAAQSAARLQIDVQALDVDFLALSGHKMYAPMGIGVLYGKSELLEQMKPFQYGGDMVEYVTEKETTFAPIPQKFEAGTQNVGGAVGLSAAIDFIHEIGLSAIQIHEQEVMSYAYQKLGKLESIQIIGDSRENAKHYGALSFTMKDAHPHDIASILGFENVAIRAGNHCAQPLLQYLSVPATSRASFGVYSTINDVDKLIDGLLRVREVLRLDG